MKFLKNDVVIVTAGKDKGKQGKIIRVIPSTNSVIVEGANMYTKHVKKRGERSGEKLLRERPLQAGKIAILNPETKKADRIGYLIDKEGGKTRIYQKTKKAIAS